MAFNLGQILGAAATGGIPAYNQSRATNLQFEADKILAGALIPGAQPMPGPIGGLPPPQAPPPGQQSMPARPPQGPPQPPVQGPSGPPQQVGSMFGGMWGNKDERPIEMGAAPQGQMPPIQPSPSGPPGGGAPPPMMGGAPPQQGVGMPLLNGLPQQGMPQLSLQTMLTRIGQRFPNAEPTAVALALRQGMPLIAQQDQMAAQALSRQLQLQGQMIHQGDQDLHRRRLELDLWKEGGREGPPPGYRGPVGAPAGAPAGTTQAQLPAGATPTQGETTSEGGLPEPKPVGGLSSEAIKAAGIQWAKENRLPVLGRNSEAARAAIINYGSAWARAEGIGNLGEYRQDFKATGSAIGKLLTGVEGRTVRSLGTIVDHLSTLEEAAKAWNANDTQLFNRIAATWAKQTGKPEPTNLETTAKIVGTELMKALGAAGAGTGKEREEAQNLFDTAKSPEQIMGAVQYTQKLLSGQLESARRQYITATSMPGASEADREKRGKHFDSALPPAALRFYGRGSTAAPATSGGGGPAPGTVQDGYRFKGGDPSKQESWEPVGGKRSSLDEGRVVSDADTRPQGGQQYAMMDDPRARRGADRFGQLPSGGGGASGGGSPRQLAPGVQPMTEKQLADRAKHRATVDEYAGRGRSSEPIAEVYQKDAQILENHVSAWAQGRMTGKELKARFNKMGWDVDLRRGRYDVEAFDPSGKAHYLTP